MDMKKMMKQAQKMQRQMEETTRELEAKEYSASAGGGAVTVTVSVRWVSTRTGSAVTLPRRNQPAVKARKSPEKVSAAVSHLEIVIIL